MAERINVSPPTESPLNHSFQDIIGEIIQGIEKGDYDPEKAFRHAWRAAYATGTEAEERIAGLDKLFNSFPEAVREALNRPLGPKGQNVLMIIASQEEKKAMAEGRLPKSQRTFVRRQTSRMRDELKKI